MTEGQELALKQLNAIESNAPDKFEVVTHIEQRKYLEVDISLHCGGVNKTCSGLPLRTRERFIIFIWPDFPFKVPSVCVPHSRFAGFPHVQWQHYLCLYQATGIEWNPKGGMYGFLDRLLWWIEQGAINQLDPIGAPIHPPVTYCNDSASTVVVHPDTPVFEDEYWLGLALLDIRHESRVDVVDWNKDIEVAPDQSAVAILLKSPMPFEFPKMLRDLFIELEIRGISRELLFFLLQNISIYRTKKKEPLYILIGSAMRGYSGSNDLRQHLVAWKMPDYVAESLYYSIAKYTDESSLQNFGKRIEELFWDWTESAVIEWCRVMENRPEIVTKRDKDAPVSWFQGKTIILWGCGAVGGHIAIWLAKAGVKKLILCDNGRVKPGILVRQPYNEEDIGRFKVDALRLRLHDIRRDIEVELRNNNIIDGDSFGDISEANLLLDTTGNRSILLKLECIRTQVNKKLSMAAMLIGHNADKSFCVLAMSNYSGGPYDVIRKSKIACCSDLRMEEFLKEFWPENRREIFQPEPGCSDPTFIGSETDICSLAANMLNTLSNNLAKDNKKAGYAHFLNSTFEPDNLSLRGNVNLSLQEDVIIRDPEKGFEVRIDISAWNEILAWTRKSRREKDEQTETGGVLFGETDLVTKTIWVSYAMGPPPDSNSSHDGFLCGTVGVDEYTKHIRNHTKNSVSYIGMWHTHPNGCPIPSSVDYCGMKKLVESFSSGETQTLMLLLATPLDVVKIGAYVYSKDDFLKDLSTVTFRLCNIDKPKIRTTKIKIGLALSGGGSRAIAFHLGCLRALNDYDVLENVEVISSVSGGSVIAGMYAYSEDSFSDFDSRVVELLKKGLTRGTLFRYFLWPPRFLFGVPILIANIITSISIFSVGYVLGYINRYIGRISGISVESKLSFRLCRPVTRTNALIATLERFLFRGKFLTDTTRNGIGIVINACELRTGSAFRFGNKETGCWRFGKSGENSIKVAEAVGASAAYPAFLPALDRKYTFSNSKGKMQKQRVLLTDGGVYDNLGVSCMLPGKSSDYSYNVYSPEFIICCAAGPGLMGSDNFPTWWPTRMKSSFETVHRKAQDSAFSALHEYTQSGRLKGFLLPYLGQQDRNLPFTPPDFVERSEVFEYPTDFFAMDDKDIERISKRGEQLTRILISHYGI